MTHWSPVLYGIPGLHPGLFLCFLAMHSQVQLWGSKSMWWLVLCQFDINESHLGRGNLSWGWPLSDWSMGNFLDYSLWRESPVYRECSGTNLGKVVLSCTRMFAQTQGNSLVSRVPPWSLPQFPLRFLPCDPLLTYLHDGLICKI